MMSKGPGLFSDFGKEAKDVLTKDYTTDQKFNVASQTPSGVSLVSTIVKKGGLFVGDVTKQLKFKNAALDIKVDTESKVSTSITVADILPSTKAIASCKPPDRNSGKFELQYLNQHANFTTAIDLNKSPAVDVSAALGTSSVAFGTEATVSVPSGSFTKYNAGVNLTKPRFSVSVILTDNGDAVKASYLQYFDQHKRGAAVGELARKFSTNESTLTVGCSYAVHPQTVVKAKLDNHGNLGALLQHELINPKSFLTIAGNFNTFALQETPKFGFALSLEP